MLELNWPELVTLIIRGMVPDLYIISRSFIYFSTPVCIFLGINKMYEEVKFASNNLNVNNFITRSSKEAVFC